MMRCVRGVLLSWGRKSGGRRWRSPYFQFLNLEEKRGDNKKMKSRNEIIQLLTNCKRKFGALYLIKKMGLFGSYARGDQTDQSDVDVLVEVDPQIGLDFVTLANSIEKELGLPTDVVSSGALKLRYRQAIESELIYV